MGPPSAIMGAMWTISTTLYHLPIWMMPSKFGKYLTMLFEEDDNNITFWPLWAPPLAPIVATCTIWTTVYPLPIRIIPAKFNLNVIMIFEKEQPLMWFFLWDPCRAPKGSSFELPWTTFILHILRYLHTTLLECTHFGSGEEDVWNLHHFGPLGPSPGPPMGPTCTIWTTLNPLPLRMIPTKFG